mmetsp:Transcript_103057/g.183100  ORF Transcript_103057/g.183100 Transcript_103057/m.183100 type:complete len:104 (-) Transcript_103057:777-1088(-)
MRASQALLAHWLSSPEGVQKACQKSLPVQSHLVQSGRPVQFHLEQIVCLKPPLVRIVCRKPPLVQIVCRKPRLVQIVCLNHPDLVQMSFLGFQLGFQRDFHFE